LKQPEDDPQQDFDLDVVPIFFFSVDSDWKLPDEDRATSWLEALADQYEFRIEELNYIFTNDAKIQVMNRDHLGHDYATDILTFDYSEPEEAALFSDVYISVERVRENAVEYGCSFDEELHRVMAHGLLHLVGFDDVEDEDKAAMREAENEALDLLPPAEATE